MVFKCMYLTWMFYYSLAFIGCAHAFSEHNLCYLTYILNLSQYLDYIDNVPVKSSVLVAIELLLLEFTLRCMV